MSSNNFPKNQEHEKQVFQRELLKSKIKDSLLKMKFSDIEVVEVLNIIDTAEDKIQELKSELIGTNINQDPTEITKSSMKQIEDLRIKMKQDLDNKVREIISRHNS